MATEPELDRERFLDGQQLRELKAKDRELVKALVCLTHEPRPAKAGEEPEDLWKAIDRNEVIDRTAKAHLHTSSPAGARFGLVCDAGLGKSANMFWLHDMLIDPLRKPQLPFMLRFEEEDDLNRLVEADGNKDELLVRFVTMVHNANPGVQEGRIRRFLERKRGHGEITLLLDGLDHALSLPEAPRMLAELLDSSQWKKCPAWISGRPYAFGDAWEKVFEKKDWTFFKVDPLGDAEIELFLKEHQSEDWFPHTPPGCRQLLGNPRLLKLICDVVHRDRKNYPSEMLWPEVLERINLDTPSKVYWRAYFDVGAEKDADSRGLIAQGLKLLPHGRNRNEAAYIGLKDGQDANYDNLPERIERVGVLLGVTAFQLHTMHKDPEQREPNTIGADRSQIRKALIARLEEAGQGNVITYDRDYDRLARMNTSHLQFLQAQAGKRVRFPDRTVQAFFAAYWAMKFGTNDRLDAGNRDLRKWIVDTKGEGLGGFDEFWQFAAEMPDALVDAARWRRTFEPCYTEPSVLTSSKNWQKWRKTAMVSSAAKSDPHDWVQWNRRMLYHSFAGMKGRFKEEVIDVWQGTFLKLKESKNEVWNKIRGDGAFAPIPAGWCNFGAGPDEKPPEGVRREVKKPFELHQTPVTNAMYELFDPAHFHNRWDGSPHPLARKRKGGDDTCPVVNVTWYDAWCFAAWCGCRLPSDLEWEHALRWDFKSETGTAYEYSFDGGEELLVDYGWFERNSKRFTHPVGKLPIEKLVKEHDIRLYDMQGNVWEWCENRYNIQTNGRVFRGGAWYNGAWNCRAAIRFRSWPRYGYHGIGFRLCLPGPVNL